MIYQNGIRGDRQRTFDYLRNANKFKTEIEADSAAGRQCEYSKITFAEYLLAFFDIFSADLTGNTEHCNRHMMANHIIPRLGDIRVRDLSATDTQKAYNDTMFTPCRMAEIKE